MTGSLSSKHSESIDVSEEECLENIIVNYYNSRESFHLLIVNSFYSLYPNLFLDSYLHNNLSTLSHNVPSQFDSFGMSFIDDIIFKHNVNKVRFDALPLQSFIREKYVSQEVPFQFIFDKDNALIFMEIEVHSLIKSNRYDLIPNFEPIHFIDEKAQNDTLIYITNPQKMCLLFVNMIHRSDILHFEIYDRIADWIEDSYLKNL